MAEGAALLALSLIGSAALYGLYNLMVSSGTW